jgi:uncharacterized membrane protein YkgB
MGRKKVSVETKTEIKIISWLKKHAMPFSRYSLATIFIWFGILKPLGLSPASDLIANTVYWFNPVWFVPFLGWWEVIIGLCILYKPFVKYGLILMAIQMVGTFLPLILLPSVTFTYFPFAPTLEGQYIIKNLVVIGAGMIIGSRIRVLK